MNSQLTDAVNSQLTDAVDSQATVVMEEGECSSGGGEAEADQGQSNTVSKEGEVVPQLETHPEPDVALSSGEAKPEASRYEETVESADGQSSATTGEEQVQSADATMASQPSSGDSDDSDIGEPQPKPTFPKTLLEFGYQFNESIYSIL